MILAGLRLGRGLTASPLLNQAAQLRTTGPYAYVRHPIYTALLTFGAGQVIASGGTPRFLPLPTRQRVGSRPNRTRMPQ